MWLDDFSLNVDGYFVRSNEGKWEMKFLYLKELSDGVLFKIKSPTGEFYFVVLTQC